MQTASSIRKRLTKAQWEELLDNYRGGDLTQREFAQQCGIGLSTLQSWLRQSSRRAKPTTASFLTVPNLLLAPPPPPTYRMPWSGGLTVAVRAGFFGSRTGDAFATLAGIMIPLSAGEAGSHAGESPAGRIRLFTTESQVREEAARPNPKARPGLNCPVATTVNLIE
ncbi:MAG TPA: hypothetical protein VF492_12250 [Verrucomicrobiae bacterium]